MLRICYFLCFVIFLHDFPMKDLGCNKPLFLKETSKYCGCFFQRASSLYKIASPNNMKQPKLVKD